MMMATAIVMIAANAGMNADAAYVHSDTNVGAGSCSVQHCQRKD